ncbi:MAG: AAA family ATPase, partial [Acidobacteriota bacterium]
IVARCLAKTKHDRHATAAELLAELEPLLPSRAGRNLAADESPYPGLNAFQESDANRFFGRSQDIAAMVTRLRDHPLVGVVGPSGVGKSSFVRAGVAPALKASGERWEVLTLRPGRHPLAALARMVERLGGTSQIDPSASHEALIARLRAEPGYVGVRLRERAEALGGQLMMFVDQLEELYTLVHDAGERRAFTAALAAIADDPAAPLRVVVSMRSDFVDRIAEDPRFTEELSRGLVLLAPPDRAGLREALVQPIELVGYRFESEAMVGEILDVLGSTAGALPLLQFAAAKLWDARDAERKLLTVASYQQIGGISGALAMHADSVIGRLDTRAQGLARRVFRMLVTPERTRAIVELADLQQLSADRGELDRLLDQLVAERLLVVQQRGAAAGSVEIVHESLIERWPTLQRWLDDDADDAQVLAQLAAAAKQWDAKGRPNGMLWRGDALDDAQRWYRQRPRELAVRDRAFLDSAIALARRGRTIRRAALIGTFVVLAAGAAGATAAYIKVHAAEQEATAARERAEAEATKATRALAESQQKEAERRAEETKRVAAETDAAHAQREVKAQAAQVAQSREQLEATNAELEAALREAKHAREQAEAASAAAKKSEAQAKAASAELATKLEAERAHVKKLEEAKKQLSTQLKD